MADDIKKIIELLTPVVAEDGCELVDAVITFESGRKTLRLYIDKPGGVIVADCSRVSHSVEDLLEVEEAIAGRYDLEVSSPGLNRPLRTREHFQDAVGKVIDVATREKLDGRGRFKGELKQVGDLELVVNIDNKDFNVPLEKISKANLVVL